MEGGSEVVMRRGAKLKKSNRSTKPARGRALPLPKYIRDNIQHPLLRLAWMAELHSELRREARTTGSFY